MKRAVRILAEFYQPDQPYSLVLGGLLADDPFLDDLDLPFRELGIFGSMADFDSGLESGLGSGIPDVGVSDVA
jgi:hypothetical protein